MESHHLEMTVLMTPDMANFSGNVHGGTLLKLLDQVAYACACEPERCMPKRRRCWHSMPASTRWIPPPSICA